MEGHWVQAADFDNMAGILDAVGLSDPQIRGLILKIKPEIELIAHGDQWEYRLITPQSTRSVTFSSGQEVDYVSMIGKPVKAQMTIGGSKLIEIHRDPTNVAMETHITREFQGDEMTTVIKYWYCEYLNEFK